MSFRKPQSLQIAISFLCLLIITFNILLYIFQCYIETDTVKWVFQMVSILMGIYGIVVIYQKRRTFLVIFFYTLLFIIVLIISWTIYNFHNQMTSVDERMVLKLENLEGTDNMYITQNELGCCEEADVTEDKLNSLSGSCCGKENNEVCESIEDIFRDRCLPLMIRGEKKNLYVRLGLDIGQTLLLIVAAILTILLNVSFKRQLNRDKRQQGIEDG